MSVTQAALGNEHCVHRCCSADTGDVIFQITRREAGQGTAAETAETLRGLSQSLGHILAALGLQGSYLLFQQYFQHTLGTPGKGERSGGSEQTGWETKGGVIN